MVKFTGNLIGDLQIDRRINGYKLYIGNEFDCQVNQVYTIEIKTHHIAERCADIPLTEVRGSEINVLIAIGRALQKLGLLEDLNADAAELVATKRHLEDFRTLVFKDVKK